MGMGSLVLFAQPGLKPNSKGHFESRSVQDVEDQGSLFTLKKMEADVLVAGGGLAGVCAAIAAARNGASVVLVQDRSRLGGNSSSEIRMHVLGANNPELLSIWRETGIIEELKLTDAATNPQRSFEMWDLLLYDKVASEKNITLLLDTSVIGAEVDSGLIREAGAISPLLEERYEITAKYFIDCTGDATLAAVSGAKYMRGREGRSVFSESLAPERGDNKSMGNSILFFTRKHDSPMPFKPPLWARRLTDRDFKHRQIKSWEYGFWWIEWGGELDVIKDYRKIRHELLSIVMGVWDYIKNSGKFPDAENWALEWVGMLPGKRESRRIIGDHVLIQRELEGAKLFPDRVAYGGWPMDDHPPGGFDASDLKPCLQIYFKKPYLIPLRSLYSVNRPNLLMAGRNISASHVAFSSTRVMATCATMGQAAGAAAAFCLQNNCLPKDVAMDEQVLNPFLQSLLRDDQALIGILNKDPEDLARMARIFASEETREGKAVNVIDGWNRDIGEGKTHQWQAPICDPGPWIRLDWPLPQTIRMIQLTFDTGLHRKLYLTGQESGYYSQIRGPQPESVADYKIEALLNGKLIKIVEEKDSFLRVVRHEIEPIFTKSLRIHVERTHGDSLARIFEIRCYA
jgi:hypothetical protein